MGLFHLLLGPPIHNVEAKELFLVNSVQSHVVGSAPGLGGPPLELFEDLFLPEVLEGLDFYEDDPLLFDLLASGFLELKTLEGFYMGLVLLPHFEFLLLILAQFFHDFTFYVQDHRDFHGPFLQEVDVV